MNLTCSQNRTHFNVIIFSHPIPPHSLDSYSVNIVSSVLYIAYDTATVEYKIVPDLSVNNDSICEGQLASLVLTTIPASSGTYSWSPGSYTTQQIEVSPPSSQTYTVSFVDSLTLCELTASGIVYVDTIPVVEIISTDDEICSGDFVTLSASSNIGNGSFLWSTGETTSSILVSPFVTDTFSVVYSKNNCFDSFPLIYGTLACASARGDDATLRGEYCWTNCCCCFCCCCCCSIICAMSPLFRVGNFCLIYNNTPMAHRQQTKQTIIKKT